MTSSELVLDLESSGERSPSRDHARESNEAGTRETASVDGSTLPRAAGGTPSVTQFGGSARKTKNATPAASGSRDSP